MPSLDNTAKIHITTDADTSGIEQARHGLDELDQQGGRSSRMGTALGGAMRIGAAGVVAIGAAAGIATVAGFGFNNSVEQATATINAFTKDGALTEQILKDIKKESLKTQFSFTDMAEATAGLIPASKQSGVALKDLIKQAEILGALNPAEGLTGGAFAIREALSGDFTSIVERFNLPRQRLNQLKAEGVPAMEAIKKAMEEMGIDYGLVEKQGQTTGARWDTMKDQFTQLAGAVTKPVFDKVSEGLSKLSKNIDFEAWTARGVEAMQRLMDGADKVYSIGVEIGKRLYEGLRDRIQQISGIATILVGKLQDGDYKGAGEQITTGLIHGLQSLKFRAGELLSAITEMMSKVDWMGLGITFGSKILPGLAIGIAAGVLNLDFGALLTGIKEHWFDILMGVLALAFLPVKVAAKLAEILARIPFAGKMMEWTILHLNSWGHVVLDKVGEWMGLFGNAFIENLGLHAPRIVPAIRAFLKNIPDAIANLVHTVDEKIGNLMFGMGNAMAEYGPRQAVAGMQHVRSAIIGAFGDAGSWLWNAGVSIISGLLGGIRSAFGSLGGSVAGGLKSVLHAAHIPGFATGVTNFSGGMALVGERGPELVQLPRGSNVYTNGQSQQMMQGGGGQSTTTYNIARVELSSSEAVREFMNIDNRNGALASMGLATARA
jgi:hypothetical protein